MLNLTRCICKVSTLPTWKGHLLFKRMEQFTREGVLLKELRYVLL